MPPAQTRHAASQDQAAPLGRSASCQPSMTALKGTRIARLPSFVTAPNAAIVQLKDRRAFVQRIERVRGFYRRDGRSANRGRRRSRSVMDLVFELPARRELGRGVRQPEQNPAIPDEASRADIEDLAEELRPGAIVLLAPGRETPDGAGLAVDLESRLDDEIPAELDLPGIDARFPGPAKRHVASSVEPELLCDEEVDRVAEAPEILAQHWTELDLVGIALRHAVTEFGEEPGIEPIFAALGELKKILRGKLGKTHALTRSGLALEFEFELRHPPRGGAVFDLAGIASLAVLLRPVVEAGIADMLERELALIDIGGPDLEIRPRHGRAEQQQHDGQRRRL